MDDAPLTTTTEQNEIEDEEEEESQVILISRLQDKEGIREFFVARKAVST